MARTIRDPDAGPIQVPPAPTREESEALGQRALENVSKKRLWPAGSASECPACGRRSFVGRDDLSEQVARPGMVVLFRHLRGARCQACQAQTLEPFDAIAVEQEAGLSLVADFQAKVSNIGSGTLGTYWPKDVVRVMKLSPDKHVFIQVLDQDTALVRFAKGTTRNGRRPRRAGARKS